MRCVLLIVIVCYNAVTRSLGGGSMLWCALACVLLTYCGLYSNQTIQNVVQLGYVCAIPYCICVRLCNGVLHFVIIHVIDCYCEI